MRQNQIDQEIAKRELRKSNLMSERATHNDSKGRFSASIDDVNKQLVDLDAKKRELEATRTKLEDSIKQEDRVIESIDADIDSLNKQIDDLRETPPSSW